MKTVMKLILYIFILGFVSCEPDPSKEGVTFEPLNFEISHLPDTSYININDTVHFYGAIPNTQDIQNGRVNIGMYLGFIDEIPIVTTSTIEIYNKNEYLLLCEGCYINSNSRLENLVLGLYTYPLEDSIRFDFSIVFYKRGTYGILLSPSFYEGDDGKSRVGVKFKSDNLGWELHQNGYPIPRLGDSNYHNKLTIAVTD